MSNGKGDTTRPPSVPRDTFAANWDRTFGKGKADWAFTDYEGQLANQLRFEAERHAAVSRHIQSLPEAAWIESLPDSPDADAS